MVIKVLIAIILLLNIIITISLCKAAGDADKYMENISRDASEDK